MQMTCLIYWLLVIDLQYINSLIKFIKQLTISTS